MINYRTFYENNGIDYDTLLRRLAGNERLVEKYIRMFIADPTYAELAQAMAAQDFQAVVIKAHTLRGIALNLSFEKLGFLCMDMVSSAHSGNIQELKAQFERVKAEYACIMKGLGN